MNKDNLPLIVRFKLLMASFIGLLMAFTMLFLMNDPFDLNYSGGILLLITPIIGIFLVIGIYNSLEKNSNTYWQRVQVGFTSFSVMLLIISSSQIINKPQTWSLNLFDSVFISTLIVGLILSMLISLMKPSKKKYH